MSSLTDGFDLVIQVNEGVIGKLLKAQHTAETIIHNIVKGIDGKRVELILNTPKVHFLTDLPQDKCPRIFLDSRVFYHSRPINDASNLGDGAVADVRADVKLSLSGGNPSNIEDNWLIVDYRGTPRENIAVSDVPIDIQNKVKDDIQTIIINRGLERHQIPPLAVGGDIVSNMGFRFLTGTPGTEPILAIGMNFNDNVTGSLDGLQESVVKRDWACALSGDYVLGKIRANLREKYPLPYRIGAECTYMGPFGSCWNTSVVWLAVLEVGLILNEIVVWGILYVHNSGALVSDFFAVFMASVKLSIGPEQDIQAKVGKVLVFAGNGIGEMAEDDIREGVSDAISSSLEDLPTFFDTQLLQNLGSIGSITSLDIEVKPTSIAIRPDAIIVHGIVEIADTDAPPIAEYSQIWNETDPGPPMRERRIFHAGKSWAPGGQIVRYRWDFLDATGPGPPTRQTKIYEGTKARFVIEHIGRIPQVDVGVIDPSSGLGSIQPNVLAYLPCLTVTDDKGRSNTICPEIQVVSPLDIAVELTTDDGSGTNISGANSWEMSLEKAPFTACISVFSKGRPVDKVLVKVIGKDYQHEEHTDAKGRISFKLEPSFFGQNIHNPKTQAQSNETLLKPFATGFVIVEVKKKGFYPTKRNFWMVKHESRADFVERIKSQISLLNERMRSLQYPEMQKICAEFADSHQPHELTHIDMQKIYAGLTDFHEPNLPRQKVMELEMSIDIIIKLINLIDQGSEVLPFGTLFGIDDTKPKQLDIARRIEDSVAALMTEVEILYKKYSYEIPKDLYPPIVNLNTATKRELVTLPGVDSSLACLIIRNRPFDCVEALTKLPDVGNKKYYKLKDYIIV